VEWPTLALAVGIYALFALVTFFHAAIPIWLLLPLGAVIVAWHSSFQHEALHGHPFRSRRLNTALATPPLSLWIPYERYRMTHLTHHRDERLTDPFDDPESNYFCPDVWARTPRALRLVYVVNATLLGRLIIGPFVAIARFFAGEIRSIRAGDRIIARIWLGHALHVAVLLAWLVLVCGIDMRVYLAGFVYGGTALMLIRSYCEHRAEEFADERTAVVENAGFLGWLFLFNNLHVAHHEKPTLPWYRLPGYWRANRERLLAKNGDLRYTGYGEIFRRYLVTPHDRPPHPFGRAPEARVRQDPAGRDAA
jgi:fatty acid desaturase